MRSIIAIQEHQISIEQIRRLEGVIRKVYADHVGPQKLAIIWNVADAKHTVTNREWSRSSACSIAVPNGFAIEKRQQMLLELEREWRAITGQHPDQMSFTAFDEVEMQDVLKGNLARFSAIGRALFLARTMVRALLSKRKYGVLISRFNQ